MPTAAKVPETNVCNRHAIRRDYAMQPLVSHSFGGAFLNRPGGIGMGALLSSIALGNACNFYTPDMLLASAGGGKAVSVGGASSQRQVDDGSRGGSDGDGSTLSDTAGGAPLTSRQQSGRATGGDAGTDTLVGAGGAGTSGADADGAGGREATSDIGSSAGGDGWGGTDNAGWSGNPERGSVAGAGGASAAGGVSVASGGATANTCWLDRMRDQSAPITRCDGIETGYWYTFLPSGVMPSLASIEPSPSTNFEREPLALDGSDAELRAATQALFKATMVGQLSAVVDQDAGIGFKLGDGVAYAVGGATLNFYYQAQYSSPNKVLRVTLPCATTESSPEGSCTANCGNHYGYDLPNTNGRWTLRSIRLDTIANGGSLKQLEGWGTYPWDGNAALSVEFDVRKYSGHFEVSVGPIWLTWPADEGQ